MGKIYNACSRAVQKKIDALIEERASKGLSTIYPERAHYSIYDVSGLYILVNYSCSLIVIRTQEVYDYAPEDFQLLMRSEWDEVGSDRHYYGNTFSYDCCVAEDSDTSFFDLIDDPEASKPVDEAVKTDIKDRIHSLVACLSDKQKEVIEIVYFSGKTEEEAAEHLGMSQPLVHYHKERALNRLKELCLESHIEPDEFEM